MLGLNGIAVMEKIHETANSSVYRGVRNQDNQPVIIKLLQEQQPTPAQLNRYKQEYEIGKMLEGLGFVSAYSLEKYQNSLLIVFEDFGGISISELLKKGNLSFFVGGVTEYFWNIAIKITDSLAKIHGANIIHKDINPNNIILNPDTERLSIIDFGISTVLNRETTTLKNPNVLEGTLAYISPEQTGRMNRSLDYRTDFYSLGATFYELLLGQLPFETQDAMELVHAHIAKPPVPPCEIKPEIPVALSDLVMKLLAKNAEDRYQSAYGIKADLEICREQWEQSGTIAAFSLGSRDISDKFQIPQKLYGREREVALLLEAFERAVSPESPGAELMLVAGYSGIGKSALVQEIYKPITGRRGYFISGKFDQLQRNIPYSALIKAFQELVRQILTENAADIQGWRSQLQGALGQQGQLIVDVIPELELILGPQAEVPELPPVEAQNRFNLLFQKFIKVFAQPAHPLALFLDDLQWADSASLTVMQLLMAEAEPGLFVIGAYRENEVSPAHPLMLTVDAIASAGAGVNRIALTPLELPQINQLTADTLNTSVATTQPLAELVQVKTQGNPFFLTEFLKSLYGEKLIEFDRERGQWQWDLGAIAARNFTDNVVELMAGKMQKLPLQTQELLQVAACIGHQFDLQTLAVVSAKSLRSVVADLHLAVAEGLVFPLGEEYRFLELEAASTSESLPELPPTAEGLAVVCQFAHDRIQQAAYSLMPSERQQAVHWQVGQMLLQNTPSHQLEQKIFTIVEQLNSGSVLITTQEERDRLAQLNLMAGQKAAAAAAYQPAFNYLKAGIDLLAADSWQVQYQLTLKLHHRACEAAYLCTDFQQMQQFAAGVMEHATSVLDRVKVYEVKIQAYTGQNQFQEAIATGLEVLKLLGVKLPAKPGKLDILRGLAATKLALAGKKTEDLIHLPPMSDPYKLAAMGILSGLHSAAYLGLPEIYPLIVFKQVILSLNGQTADSTFVYAAYGVILCGIVGDIDGGYRFGQLAIQILNQTENSIFKAKTIFNVNIFIKHWKEHIKNELKLVEAYQSGLEGGDIEYASYAAHQYCFRLFYLGRELEGVAQEMEAYREAIAKLKQGTALNYHNIYYQTVLNLMGETENPLVLSGAVYNENIMLPVHIQAQDAVACYNFYFNRMLLAYLFGDGEQALENAKNGLNYLDAVVSSAFVPLFTFYHSLTLLAALPGAAKAEQKRLKRQVQANQKKMQKWGKFSADELPA